MSIDIRRAAAADAAQMADVWLRSFAAALPTVRRAHGDDEVRDWIRHVLVPAGESFVAVAGAGGPVVGLLTLGDHGIDQLYLDPERRGQGLGARFVDLAKAERPDGLELWTFQVNRPARRFYARHGFAEVELTDGSGNEEGEPDVRLAWRP